MKVIAFSIKTTEGLWFCKGCMCECSFIIDRMFGRLVTRLRMLGYDTIYIADAKTKPEKEDDFLLLIAKVSGRILITRDKALAERAKKFNVLCHYMKKDKPIKQLEELYFKYNLDINPKMVRCSICNSHIRRVDCENEIHILDKPYVPKRLIDEGTDFWFCLCCGQVYWKGSHWKNMINELKLLN